MEKSCISVNEEGINNTRKLLRDFSSFCRGQSLPVFVASWDKSKQNPIMETVLPVEVGIEDTEININFDKFMKEYMYLRIEEKKNTDKSMSEEDTDEDTDEDIDE